MNTAVIIQVQILCMCMFLILLDTYLGVELLGYMATLCLTIWETCRFFSRMAVPFLVPPAVYEGSSFSTFSPTLPVSDHSCPQGVWSSFGFILLMANAIEHSFVCFLASLGKCLQILGPFFNWVIGLFICWVARVVYVFQIPIPFQIWLENTFSHSVDCLFTLLMVSFEAQVLILIKRSLSAFVTCAVGVVLKKPLPAQGLKDLLLCFLQKMFIVFALTLRSRCVCSELSCVVWGGSPSSFFCMGVSSCPSIACWKDYSFPLWIVLVPSLKISLPLKNRGVILGLFLWLKLKRILK